MADVSLYMKRFYVYAIFRPDGTPCYIGKGQRNRYQHHRYKSSNQRLARIYKKAKGNLPEVIVRDSLTEKEAFETEIALIAAIGRKGHGGPLVNFSDGGEGPSGLVHSAATKCLLSQRTTEYFRTHAHPRKGLVQPDEMRIRISGTLKAKGIRPPSRLGTTSSIETKAKQSAASKGKPKNPNSVLAGAKKRREQFLERQRLKAGSFMFPPTEEQLKRHEEIVLRERSVSSDRYQQMKLPLGEDSALL